MTGYDIWKTTDTTDYGDSDLSFCRECDKWLHEDDDCACNANDDLDEDGIDACNAYWADSQDVAPQTGLELVKLS